MVRRAVVVVFAVGLTLAAIGAPIRPARAAITVTWTGGDASNSLWSDPDNWSPGVPVAGDTVVFPAVAARKTNTNNLAANTSFDTIRFTGSGYVIGGNAIVITDVLENDPGSGSNTVNLAFGGTGDIENESGTLILTGNNASFAGEVVVDTGLLIAASPNALGMNVDIRVDTTAALRLTGGNDLSAAVVQVEGDGAGAGVIQSVGGVNTIGTLELDASAVVAVGNSTLIVETLTHAVGATLGLVGGGKLQVESAFYAGTLFVEEGNLTWNASSQAFIEVHTFGWLRGNGVVAAAQVNGGLVWPGSGNDPGILEVFGATTFASGRFRVDLDGPAPGTGYGRLVTSGLTLAPAVTLLEVDLTFVPVLGQVFTIIQNDAAGPVQGAFRDLPEGATFIADGLVLQVSYKGGDGNDVTLKVLRQASADLKLEMTAQPSPAGPGDVIAYTIKVTNLGPDTATGVTPTMGTPVGTTFVSASGPAEWDCFKPNQSPSVTCMGRSLTSGDSATFTFLFRVNANATGSISATAGVSSASNDANSANNAVTLSTPLGASGGKPFKLRVPGVAADSAGSSGG